VRALELAGQGASLAPAEDRLWAGGMRRPAVVAIVSWPRAELRARIAARTEAMLAGGAIEEVRALRERRVEPSATAAGILGLAQIGAHLDARTTLAECAAEITLRTGQYARRQETWARRIPGAIELAGADGPERNADRLLELIR
jgi:tRNA A37 N6-isopentenylltransferase MiaA